MTTVYRFSTPSDHPLGIQLAHFCSGDQVALGTVLKTPRRDRLREREVAASSLPQGKQFICEGSASLERNVA